MPQQTTTTAFTTAGPKFADGRHLKVWSGEVLKTFYNETVLKGRVRERMISSGSSAQFPAIGRPVDGAEYHTPGNLIIGTNVASGEVTIPVNDLLITSRFLSNWEEAVNHYEVRSEYTRGMGQDLGQAYDRHLFALAAGTARTAAAGPTTGFGGAATFNIGAAPTVTAIINAFYTAATRLDVKNIPRSDRYAYVAPATYWALVQDGRVLNRDFGNDQNGNQAGPTALKIAGFEVIQTNNMALDFSLDANMVKVRRNGVIDTSFNVNNTNMSILFMHREALGVVKLMEMATESEWKIERQGWLTVSKMALGYGALRTEAIEAALAV